jgi:hypothetical protein
MSLRLGDIAPDFQASTTQGPGEFKKPLLLSRENANLFS